ncbi:ornithine carbamoyltransferase, mitochondrial-like isoform X3 [Ischnura elegans]|nr:ornithine carbamoyltransferase, mitochondrial-like isoform X3 [Ischnura elegans]XP_046383748.1 ornithine carbamoyltransferase, mitochondrial-like isoform X3 [Ischnura elegans]XP_046383749.1 ornithine carbamoyltransferase, mitochondrial-like isoform X3 [Ischnura elegans]
MCETNGLLMSSLLCECSVKTQLNIEKASQVLGLRNCNIVDKKWELAQCVDETGRLLSIMPQVVLASSSKQGSLRELAAGASVPVINMGSPDANPLSAMAHAMTILTCLSHLERIRIAWVGPSDSAVLASLLLMMPKFRTHLHMATENCNTPANLEKALKLAASYRSEIHHSISPEDATYRADALITTSHTFNDLRITKKMVDEASLKWIFLHDLPRTRNEVTDDVFHHKKNSLVWESAENHAWILMAVLVNVLTDYAPTIPPPKFTEE